MTTLRDKAARLRRDHIVEAATAVFAAKGYHRATIRDIARQAGIADGTIYASFENKAALLMAILDPLDEASATLPPVDTAPDLRTFLSDAIRRRFAALTDDKLAVLRVILSEALVNEEIRTLFVERVLGPALALPLPVRAPLPGAKGGPIVQDPIIALRLVIGAVMGLSTLRLLGDQVSAERWHELGDALGAALLDGFGPREGAP